MTSSIVCSLSGYPVIEAVINKTNGYVYEKSTILCHLRTYGTCPHTGAEMKQNDLIPIITGNSTSLTANSHSVSELIQKLGNQYDSLILQAYSNKQELQKLREQLAVSLYHQDGALRVIAKLKGEIKQKKSEILQKMEIQRQKNAAK